MALPIKIACKGSGTRQLNELIEFQGNLKDLTKDRYNRLKKEILELGFSSPIHIWNNDGKDKILDGHQRLRTLKTMREEGFEIPPIPVVQVEADDEKQAKRKVLSLTSQFGEITKQGLYEFMSEADIHIDEIMESFRFPEIDLDSFKTEFFDEPKSGLTEDDEIPEVKEPFVKLGELWQLGRHRLLCGDSTDKLSIDKLMNGEKADMVYTDPPYGVDYDGGTTKREKLAGDSTTDLYGPACLMAYQHSTKDAPLYIWHAGTLAAAAAAAAKSAGYVIRSELIWNKNLAQFGALSAQYKQKHEPFYYCFKKGQTVNWCGPTNEVSVWDVSRESKNEFHPTQKPTELAERAMKNHSAKIVLDLFLGSGATLIAAEKIGRTCFGVELNENYASVIIERWQKFTGETAERLT